MTTVKLLANLGELVAVARCDTGKAYLVEELLRSGHIAWSGGSAVEFRMDPSAHP
jgi:hypothetical protein